LDILRPIVSALLIAPVPVAMGIAIFRYRLYDIDVLINRTVVYGATTAAIAGTFFAGIVALQAVLRPLTAGQELAVAASTLGSFALFQPIRRAIQRRVDRRFNRARYDASRTLDSFADHLRDEVDLDSVRSDLLAAVGETMAPVHASLWLRERTP
jgi:branched-subunit amino acid ABC-type transport system permease component